MTSVGKRPKEVEYAAAELEDLYFFRFLQHLPVKSVRSSLPDAINNYIVLKVYEDTALQLFTMMICIYLRRNDRRIKGNI
jgi:hypothetical protein